LAEILPPTTAGIKPALFSEELAFCKSRSVLILLIAIFLVTGFALRTYQLGRESLGEDELNKLQTVAEYRQNGLSGKNGEHPFLMKGLQTLSVSAFERWNHSAPAGLIVSPEAALRFPIALFGTFTVLLIYLLASGLFGRSIGIIAAGLWAVEPTAIGFDRIAKEDSLVVFFFILALIFWVRSQTEAETGNPNWFRYALGSAGAFAALMASKYYPHLLAILGGYYNVFKHVPGKKWNLGPNRWLAFFFVMGISFLVLNPTIMLPETWREMLKFSSENRIGHDSYEFMGSLYRNQMSAWLSGVPWTFYYVFIAVKISISTLLLFLVGIPLVLRKKMGDGRFLIFFWAFMWFLPFTFLGGKFTRYFTFVTPLVMIIAAVGLYHSIRWLVARLNATGTLRGAIEYAALAVVLLVPFINSIAITPHYRMFTNTIGGGNAAAGSYFPHDEFYDAATRQAVEALSVYAREGTVVASETPGLYEFYADPVGRGDIGFVSLSDKSAVKKFGAGDIIVLIAGRRYFSNTPYHIYLESESRPVAEAFVAGRPAVKVYLLDERSAAAIRDLSK
jgi:hypothetical protein